MLTPTSENSAGAAEFSWVSPGPRQDDGMYGALYRVVLGFAGLYEDLMGIFYKDCITKVS